MGTYLINNQLLGQFTFGTTGFSTYKNGPFNYFARQISRSGTKIDGFSRLRRTQPKPWLPPDTHLVAQEIGLQIPTQFVTLKNRFSPTIKMNAYGNWAVPNAQSISLPGTSHTALYDRAFQKLGTQMNGSSFNLPLFLMEAHKSIDMIRDAAQDIAKKLSGARTRREMHNLWLEYRYGWRLLVRDIYDALKALHDIRTRGVVFKTKAIATSEDAGSATYPYGSARFVMYATNDQIADAIETYRIRRTCVITLKWVQTCPALGTLQQLGISNPLNLAWELIPYSFVVDWFFPVGDYLSSLDVFIGKAFQGGCVTYTEEWKRSMKPTNFRERPGTNNGWFASTPDTTPACMTERYYKRTALSNFPAASLPKVDVNINPSRALDAIALLRQLRR